MTCAASTLAGLEQHGFALLPRFTTPEITEELRRAVEEISFTSARAGLRDLLRVCPRVAAFAGSPGVVEQLIMFTRARPFAVRGILFDKTPDANWRVVWHQDVTIAVREQRGVPDFGPWSVKDGVPHAHAPASLLERMVTLRLHLDACDETNGALRVIPGSHRNGKLTAADIEEWKARGPQDYCLAEPGDALLMRPLLLHASSPATAPRHRRVIHLEFAVDELPGGLAWAERISA